MVNFTSAGITLINDVEAMINAMGFLIKTRTVVDRGKIKYVLRISKDVGNFIKIIDLWKL